MTGVDSGSPPSASPTVETKAGSGGEDNVAMPQRAHNMSGVVKWTKKGFEAARPLPRQTVPAQSGVKPLDLREPAEAPSEPNNAQ